MMDDTGVLIMGIVVVVLMVAVIIGLRIRFKDWVRRQKMNYDRDITIIYGSGQLIDTQGGGPGIVSSNSQNNINGPL